MLMSLLVGCGWIGAYIKNKELPNYTMLVKDTAISFLKKLLNLLVEKAYH